MEVSETCNLAAISLFASPSRMLRSGAPAISVFLLPTLFVWTAGDNDVLPVPEAEFEN